MSTVDISAFNVAFYNKARNLFWRPVTGAAYPRFNTYYYEASSQADRVEPANQWWRLTTPALNGGTLAQCFDDAKSAGATIVQVR